MTYGVGEFELDPLKFELRRDGAMIGVEPQVLALLLFLIEQRERLVTKDEIIERVWQGRIVSETALTSRLKSARQALGDDGHSQRVIRTIHGQGYRFVAQVREAPAAPAAPEAVPGEQPRRELAVDIAAGKPTIAVLPFARIGGDSHAALVAEALPHEMIAELSRLRWLFVIARGSSFRFREATPDVRRIGSVLGVRYCLSGSVSADAQRMDITVELSDTHDGGVIWAEHYCADTAAIHEVRSRIVTSVAATVELQIPLREAQIARLRSPDDLDAWSAYHLGLQHAFRFNARDNARAITLFEQALAREPDFGRAHAGLSFAHFQNAFLNYVPDRRVAVLEARRSGERALEIDALDPFANFTFGRSLWLESNVGGSLVWFERAVALSPNYAQGHYARAWAETILGNGEEGQCGADAAIALSPIDPMLYAMLATRAFTHLIRGEYKDAACWAEEAAQSPGAHALVALIAAACHGLNGDDARAQAWTVAARARDPAVSRAHFFRSFPFAEDDARATIGGALARLGL